MDDSHSITYWISEIKKGSQEAAQQLWERYAEQLVRLARRQMSTTNRRLSDEDDIALMAFQGFCRGVEQQRFGKLDDRNDLQQLLVMLTNRRVIDAQRRAATRARHEVGESVVTGHPQSTVGGLDHIFAVAAPSPDDVVEVREQLENLMKNLDDAMLCRIATLKLEGFTNEEIAKRVGCVPRTVERKLRLIRKAWNDSNPSA